MFANLDREGSVTINGAPSVRELKCLEQFKIPERVLDEDKKGPAADTVLLSYHHWTNVDLTTGMVLASYLDLWLKSCVVPSTCLGSVLF